MDDMFQPPEPDRIKSSVETTKHGTWRDWFTGSHSATYRVPVPEGVDPRAFSQHVSTSIGEQPAPFSPFNKVTDMPTPTVTIGNPSKVSMASSSMKDDHVVDVEAMPNHILGGKNGTSSGITYHTVPQQDEQGKWFVQTDKESYGKGKWPVLNPVRHAVGSLLLDPHIANRIDGALSSFPVPKEAKH